MPATIKTIMEPKSIAVIGATDRIGSVGRAVVTNIIEGGFTGVLYPVNPRARSVVANRAYPTIKDIPDDVDMAVVIVPAPMVVDVVEQAAEKGASGVVVITAGFKEVGGEGVKLENELKAVVKERGIRLIGPNCLGIINTAPGFSMNASFAQAMPAPGNIGFISQSGAMCTAVLDLAMGRNIGFSKFISFGNKADVSEIDLLEYLGQDPDTDVILMYLEDITDGRKFMDVARKITWKYKKPMLAIKSGRSEEGAKAVSSHTGSLAGSDASYDAIFQQSGIQRVEDVNEMFHYATAFSQMPLPRGNRIAIVTNAGGPGIMTTDAAVRHGLKLAEFGERTKRILGKNLPPTANINNPVDVIGDADYQRYEAALRAVVDDGDVDGAIVVLTPQKMTDVLETAQMVPRVLEGVVKPVLCSFMGIVDVSVGVRYLEENNIPNYSFPEEAVRALKSMVHFSKDVEPNENIRREYVHYDVDSKAVNAIIKEKLKDVDRVTLPQSEANEILKIYGFPVLQNRVATSPEEVKPIMDELGTPVVMKIISRDIVHKFDAGGVMLNIESLEEAQAAYDQILLNAKAFKEDAVIDGVLVEQMAEKGVEIIIGSHNDPSFGPMCMFGLGGTFVEAIGDVSFRLAPMWESSAVEMIGSTKASTILGGLRGKPPSDIDAIKDCLLRLSQLVTDHPEIVEMDINPLIVYPKGCKVADSRITLAKREDADDEEDESGEDPGVAVS
ncbi:acetyl coenzyme A synthetase (ADP forming), alpha domain protein [Desulfatibacillum aliphaticivorans]|uniref:Acetyl coenzyme A synthetase (ADP forming), alpha domain protein n=1 Tax=Desulfatibacillum aliphaticivorans TaxID=218208 RepID=B8FK52_DESAL|nr:acetate--CoA ligase [Desulfatibacillum aliphaticivorans]ACL02727.1 acetyl coenzyme A synthetase (ADP forming), alpha domain protein [Desulfatibacillum aliphaticivorans]